MAHFCNLYFAWWSTILNKDDGRLRSCQDQQTCHCYLPLSIGLLSVRASHTATWKYVSHMPLICLIVLGLVSTYVKCLVLLSHPEFQGNKKRIGGEDWGAGRDPWEEVVPSGEWKRGKELDSIGSWGDGVDKQMNTTKWERSGLGGGEKRKQKKIIFSLVGEEKRNPRNKREQEKIHWGARALSRFHTHRPIQWKHAEGAINWSYQSAGKDSFQYIDQP